jgi:hypothetical protein
VPAPADWRIVPAIALLLASLAIASAYIRASALSPVIYYDYGYGVDRESGPITQDILFDSDVSKRFEVMTTRSGDRHNQTREHPLMSPIMYYPTRVLRIAGLAEIQAVRMSAALAFGVWSGLLFWLLTIWGCRSVDAATFVVLGQVSASAMIWSAVPETFVLGSASIVAALILTMRPKWMSPLARYTLAIVLSVSMSVTNAMAGLFAAARRLSGKDLWIAGASAWTIVTILWLVLKALFPTAVFFFPPSGQYITAFLGEPTVNRLGLVLQAIFSHSIVMPDIQIVKGLELHGGRYPTADIVMSVQRSPAGSGSVAGAVATAAWGGLLALGAWAAWAARSGVGNLCLLILAGQVALHVAFGPETFLYTMHMVPLLVVLVAAVAFTRLRVIGLVLAAVVIVAGGANNSAQFNKAVSVVQELDAYARTFPGARP